MTIAGRIFKQFVYLLLFLVVGVIVFYYAYLGFRTEPEPTPLVIPINPPEVIFVKVLKIKGFDYDIVAQIRNPNPELGSSDVLYEFKFLDENRKVFGTKTGKTYILPGQTRYLMETPVNLSQNLSNIELDIVSVSWEKLVNVFLGDISLPIISRELIFNKVPGVFAALNGILENSSDFDLDQAEILAILHDKNGEIIAMGKTSLRTILARGRRAFGINWFNAFENDADKIEAEAYTNLLENSNFIRRFGAREKFQEFY